jgi:SAM-dependent methyltransferase
VTIREAVLGTARGFQAFKAVTGATRVMTTVTSEYLRPVPGERILDVGCGFGDLRRYLTEVEYVGIDLNDRYIDYARRHQPPARFINASVTDLGTMGLGGFDGAIALGVLHHLGDEDATELLKALPDVLVPGGRFVAVEPVWAPDQRTTARVLAALDRGRYVRDQRGYEELVAPWFPHSTSSVRHDLFRFPYSHCIVQASLAG